MSVPLILQLLVVVAPHWDAVEGMLYCYERPSPLLAWKLCGAPIAVALGRSGLAWGRGIHDIEEKAHKKEGDGRSPAGLFSLGPVFGDAEHQSYARNMPFLLITEELECVDDPDSLYYNQFVNAQFVEKRDWKSSEKMKEIGAPYAIGVVVQHNLSPIKAKSGSAIFMHIWEDKGRGTAGCTAMKEEDLNSLVSWLDVKKHPCLLQLPLTEYANKKNLWGLPELPG